MQTSHDNIISALLTDSYKIIMAYSFYCSNMNEDPIVCELFFRKCPFGGEYAIVAGLSDAVEYLKEFKFTNKEVEFLKEKILPPTADPKFFDYLLSLDCSKVKVRAIREGSIVFPNEPILSIEGPQAIVQIVETPLINFISFPTLVATNASRMRTLTGPNAALIEFGLRRAQGPDGAFSASKFSYLGGFDGTSNVVAGLKCGIPVMGTVAHSYITSFSSIDDVDDKIINNVNIKQQALKYRDLLQLNTIDGELASFIAFAFSMPHNFLVLADTYDTLSSGVPNFVCVALALEDAGYKARGIRLDSGDLAKLSRQAKQLYQEYGKQFNRDTSHWKVCASNDINESALQKFNEQTHSIDIFGIGTNLVTCQKQPALGMVYKLVECKGRGTMKLSEEIEKTTLPCQKNVWRCWMSNQIVDVISTFNERISLGDEIQAIDPKKPIDRYIFKPHKIEELLVPVLENHKINQQNVVSLQDARLYCKEQLNHFQETIKINQPKPHLVLLTQKFFYQYRSQLESLIINKQIQ